ncbi:MAG: S9 family peptidase [Acidobacteria bacterium]|nr:S9 family peptidase [Acidobacteriota bacterium]
MSNCSILRTGLMMILVLGTLTAIRAADTADDASKGYPAARLGDTVDDYHGVKIADPYRWLEDPDSAETRAWIEAENTITFGYLEGIPARLKIRERLTRLWNYERFGIPFREGGRYFYTRNDGLQNQSVLYSADALDGEPRVLIDPNTWSTDGTVALADYAVSPDGKWIAFGVSSGGSDWTEWRIRDVATGQDLPDRVQWVKFSGAAWTKDGAGFFYSRYDAPDEKSMLQAQNYFQKLYYHQRGTPQSEDVLVYERKDQKEWGFGGSVTEDGRFLGISVWQGTDVRNRFFYKELAKSDRPVVELLPELEASYYFLGNVGDVFYFKTDLGAPRGRVIAIDIRRPERAAWREVLPQAADTLEFASLLGGRLVAGYMEDAASKVSVYSLDGRLERIVALPGLGSVAGFGGRADNSETFFLFTNFVTPGAIYRYDVATGAQTPFRRPKVDFDPDRFEVRRVFYTSKDGTRVPMFLAHRKGLKLDGNNPVYLYGYGGFNASSTPFFSVSNLVWMEMGGVYALACIRGGGEYGEEWHQAGMKLKKQNVFDDFIAAGEWLIAEKFTSTSKLAIGGASNGGLLVGACLTQRPDLFGAAVPEVGVMDMLRFHKFTIGWAWVSDFGSPDNPEEFKAIRAYSPLHNIKPGTRYPATLITTADHDDRVVPAHSFKFAAALQAAQAGPAPVIIRIETRAGHGGGKPVAKQIEEIADIWSFLVRELGIMVH